MTYKNLLDTLTEGRMNTDEVTEINRLLYRIERQNLTPELITVHRKLTRQLYTLLTGIHS